MITINTLFIRNHFLYTGSSSSYFLLSKNTIFTAKIKNLKMTYPKKHRTYYTIGHCRCPQRKYIHPIEIFMILRFGNNFIESKKWRHENVKQIGKLQFHLEIIIIMHTKQNQYRGNNGFKTQWNLLDSTVLKMHTFETHKFRYETWDTNNKNSIWKQWQRA